MHASATIDYEHCCTKQQWYSLFMCWPYLTQVYKNFVEIYRFSTIRICITFFSRYICSSISVFNEYHTQNASGCRKAQWHVVLFVPFHGRRWHMYRQYYRQLFEFHEKMQRRRIHLYGEEILVHNEYGECNVRSENVVARTTMCVHMRIRLHCNWWTNQIVCVHILLHNIIL